MSLSPAATREVRAFGAVLFVALSLAAIHARVHHRPLALVGSLGVSGALLGLGSRLAPAWVRPVERAWMALGKALGRVTTPVLLVAVFVLLLVPMRALLWLFGRDPLAMKRDPAAKTYWIERARPTFAREDFERLS